ncbi:MAG: NAD-dependent epimerase/dehydratase family protein [Niastella sp.]|nr:NAD-dependent epimerase/dehydratase family protein [Niastella sp.]
MKTVGIIGGSGFIGSYITKIFLEENYQVRVSTTSFQNIEKYQHLFSLANSENMMVMPLDVREVNLLEEFVDGCEILVHAGTPFVLDIKDPVKELFEPTVQGTRNILDVVSRSRKVKKVVIIASIASWNTSFPLNPATYSPGHIFTEEDSPYFSDNDHPYGQAKYFADQEVRKFINDHPDLPFEVTSLSPTWVVGNSLSERKDSTSLGMQYLIKNKITDNPFIKLLFEKDVKFSMIDVRDVAEAVFQAATIWGIHGRNYLIANESYSVSDISRMLNNEEPIQNAEILYNSALAKKELGIAFIAAKETLLHCM